MGRGFLAADEAVGVSVERSVERRTDSFLDSQSRGTHDLIPLLMCRVYRRLPQFRLPADQSITRVDHLLRHPTDGGNIGVRARPQLAKPSDQLGVNPLINAGRELRFYLVGQELDKHQDHR